MKKFYFGLLNKEKSVNKKEGIKTLSKENVNFTEYCVMDDEVRVSVISSNMGHKRLVNWIHFAGLRHYFVWCNLSSFFWMIIGIAMVF